MLGSCIKRFICIRHRLTLLPRLDQFPIRGHTRRDIRPEWILVWTVLGKPVTWKKPYARDAKPKHKAFAQMWSPIAQQLLDKGLIETHPTDVRSGGLEAVWEGADMVRKGQAGGKKLIYPIAEPQV